ncbi:hypothetical protein HNR44_000434 [Geomicrobium halophilum]|uniref:Uncharacterized protein n=1 Tax=Geomicrobium halophilum TaxID=549000 RepID=A0A841PX28_9BACL|nr:hypothetical protein [Geomicrobium halophilum]
MTVINAKKAIHRNDGLYLVTDRSTHSSFTPTSRLLADSDNFALVYIFEQDDEFVQIHIHEDLWPAINEIYRKRKPIFLDEPDVEFEDIHEELDMLLDVIQGNNNYGAEMVRTVEKHFLDPAND